LCVSLKLLVMMLRARRAGGRMARQRAAARLGSRSPLDDGRLASGHIAYNKYLDDQVTRWRRHGVVARCGSAAMGFGPRWRCGGWSDEIGESGVPPSALRRDINRPRAAGAPARARCAGSSACEHRAGRRAIAPRTRRRCRRKLTHASYALRRRLAGWAASRRRGRFRGLEV